MDRGRMRRYYAGILAVGMVGAWLGWAQAQMSGRASAQTIAQTTAQPSGQLSGTYQPKFPGDPARSESEAQALGYMRVVLRAEREYKKRTGKNNDSVGAASGARKLHKRDRHTPRGPR